jgi:hypothetical protein
MQTIFREMETYKKHIIRLISCSVTRRKIVCPWKPTKSRSTVSRPVCLRVKPHLGPKTRFLLLSGSCWFVDVERSLWRVDGSVVYSCSWSSPAQSFSGPILAGLMTIFDCLRFQTPSTWRASSPYLYPPGTGRPSYTPRHKVPFSSPPTTRRAKVEVLEPAYSVGGGGVWSLHFI